MTVIRAEVDHGTAELVNDAARPRCWTLLVDGTPQSHVDLDDPTHLEFEYVRRLGHVVDLVAPPHRPVRALHLGGGAWSLARYVAATRPGSSQTVVELDAALAALVTDRLPAEGAQLTVHIADARAALTEVRAASVDLLVLDVFVGARTPAHLTTREFLDIAAAALAPDGVYAANVADGGALAFAGSQIAAAMAVFAHVAVIVAADVRYGRRFGNVVLVASAAELPLVALSRAAAGDPFPSRVLAGDDLIALVGRARPPHDATAAPSPTPPPGFFGRPPT